MQTSFDPHETVNELGCGKRDEGKMAGRPTEAACLLKPDTDLANRKPALLFVFSRNFGTSGPANGSQDRK